MGLLPGDRVLTWRLMQQGARVYHEPSAVAFTAAPARLVHLARQRARRARGMIEGIRSVKPLTLVVNAILYRFRRCRVCNLLGLRVRRITLGFLGFVLTYQLLMPPIAVAGYGQELLGLRRRWK